VLRYVLQGDAEGLRRNRARDEHRGDVRSQQNDGCGCYSLQSAAGRQSRARAVIHFNESSRLMAMRQNLPNSLKLS
jgi:hypothetical protein